MKKTDQQLKQAIKYWSYVAPLVAYPTSKKQYEQLVTRLDDILILTGNDKKHELTSLVDIISDLIERYEAEHYPAPKTSGTDALHFLMQEHQLGQKDLPEIGSQGVISEILNGRRELNLRQIKLLSKRFNVSTETFID